MERDTLQTGTGSSATSKSSRWWILVAIFGPSFVYAVLRRHWSDFLLYSYLAAAPLAILFFFGEGGIYFEKAKNAKERRLLTLQFLFVALVTAVLLIPLGGLLYALGVTLIDLMRWIVSQLSDRSRSAALAMGVTAALGGALFWFRLRYRSLYGCTEAIVGLSVAGHRVAFEVAQVDDLSLALAVLTAGVYLVVRGLDNVHQGWKSGSDPALASFLAWWRDRYARLPD